METGGPGREGGRGTVEGLTRGEMHVEKCVYSKTRGRAAGKALL